MPRPTKLTPEAHKAIVEAIGLGATYATAAGVAGVDYTTFLNWMSRGERANKGPFFEFFHAVKKAEAECKFKATRVIIKAMADGDAKMALEYLKRRDRLEWGDNVKIDVGAMTDAELLRLLGLAQAAPAGGDDVPEA